MLDIIWDDDNYICNIMDLRLGWNSLVVRGEHLLYLYCLIVILLSMTSTRFQISRGTCFAAKLLGQRFNIDRSIQQREELHAVFKAQTGRAGTNRTLPRQPREHGFHLRRAVS